MKTVPVSRLMIACFGFLMLGAVAEIANAAIRKCGVLPIAGCTSKKCFPDTGNCAGTFNYFFSETTASTVRLCNAMTGPVCLDPTEEDDKLEISCTTVHYSQTANKDCGTEFCRTVEMVVVCD